jgi:tetratricopeptide (TPR) repeat protein
MKPRALLMAIALVLLATATEGAFYEWGGPARRGVRQLKRGEDAAAVHSFGEARAGQPTSSAVRYDQGLAFRRVGLADSARAAFEDAQRLRGDEARSAATYDLGNEALRQNQLDDAIARYRESLRVDSRRADAKKNLEEALRRLRQAKPPQSPPPSKGSGSKGPSGPGSGGGGGGGNQQPNAPPDQGAQPPPQASRGPIPSKSEAELWLDALESERRSERQKEKQQTDTRQENVRDW